MPDSRHSARLACVLAAACLLGPGSAFALIYTYDNTTSATITDNSCGAAPAGGIDRTFTVADSFTVSTIALGINISHATRGQVRVTIIAPGGSTFQAIATSGDADDNYDVLISSNSEGGIDDADADPVGELYYSRLVSDTGNINFYTGNSVGAWTVRICDNAAGTTGTFNRARLILTSTAAPSASCTGTALFDWDSGGIADLTPLTTLTSGDVTVTQGATSDAAGTASVSFVRRTTVTGNMTGFYRLSMDASAVGGTQDNEAVGLSSTLSFSRPVRDFGFTFLDVDITTGAWEDQVQVIGLGPSGGRVPYSLSPVSGANAQLAGEIAEGDTGGSSTTQTTGNVTVAFSGAVSSITLNYTQGSDPASENVFMFIGLSDFSFCAYDYGDAPNTYGTQLAGGARHAIGDRTLYLGANPADGEADGQPGTATTDDTTQVGGVDDEDGVASFPAYTGGSTTYTVSVSAVNQTGTAASLVGYIDWNRDGDFTDANEISATTTVAANTSSPTAFNVTWTSVPTNAGGTTETYARFRLAFVAAEATSPTGAAASGEVEDYLIPAGTLPVTVAWVDSARHADGYRVEWITSSETSNIGFRLLGKVPTGFVELDRQSSQAVDSSRPLRYEAEFGRRPGVRSVYIEEIDTRGRTRLHGPYRLGRAYGERPVERPIEWARVREQMALDAAAEKGSSATTARLLVRERAIQRLTHEQLLAAGVDLAGSRGADLALLDNGKPVARFVGGPAVWGPGSFVEFFFAPARTLASPYDVLELKVDAKNARAVKQGAGVSGSAPLAVFPSEVSVAFDRAYSFASPTADPWFDERLLSFGGPASLRRIVELPDWVAGDVELRVDYWGVTSWEGTRPDHRVVLRFNGARLADDEFDGLTARARTFAVGGLVTSSLNELEVTVPGTTGFAFDLVHFEGVRAVYQRAAMARDGRLDAVRPSQIGVWSATRFGQREVVAWSGETRWQLTPDDGTIVLPEASDPFFLADVAGVALPVVLPGIPAPVDSLQADYLIVTHPLFAAELDRLVDLQKSRGLKTQVVTTDAIYARYSDHAPSAEAIRRYIADAKTPPRFALLVGGESYDPHDHLGLGSISFVPTSYRRVNEFVAFGPTDEAMADLDGDQVPDLAIGRLPVRTVGELEIVTNKMVEWGRGYSAPQALIVSGRSDESSPIKAVGDRHAAMLTGWKVWRSSVDNLGPAVVRSMVRSSLSYGTTLISFVGHTAFSQWDFQPVLTTEVVQQLPSAWTPTFVAQWGCWNAYFASPEVMTLSTELLLQPGGGAFGVIGSSTLTSVKSHQLLGERFLAYVGAGSKTVGEALLAAKRELGAAGETYRDAILSQVLLGDPATPLPAGKR